MKIINWPLAKQPLNWLVVILMLVIVGMAGHLLLSYLGVEPASAES